MTSPLLPVYRRTETVMTHGEGVYLFDADGERYLDFAAGIATNAFGHAHPVLVEALMRQASRLWHCSNIFHTPELDAFAEAVVSATFADKVFFCSSGTEAVEAAIKTVRRYHHHHGTGRDTILTAEGAFHGRTLGALSACSYAPSREGFGPLLEGFASVPFNDIAALEAAVDHRTAAILLETIQGEGGVRAHSAEYLQRARAICDEHGLLLVLDEIQCGWGRTGQLLAFEAAGIAPDIATVAKGIGSGFPLAGMLVTDVAGIGMTPGSHGSTYGSNPLSMAVGHAVLDLLLAPGFLNEVARLGGLLKARLQTLAREHPAIYEAVRGEGLMLALSIEKSRKAPLAQALRENGLLVAPAVGDVLRIVPPLIITESHIDEAAEILDRVARSTA